MNKINFLLLYFSLSCFYRRLEISYLLSFGIEHSGYTAYIWRSEQRGIAATSVADIERDSR